MLSCSCDDSWSDWYYYLPNDFTVLPGRRRKRCCSCSKLIDIGADCLEFERNRPAKNEIEEEIYGNDVELASWWMCFDCGGIYLSLYDAGFECVDIEDVKGDLREYWDLTGFKKDKKL